jgi:peroxiredoxin Q/BCP
MTRFPLAAAVVAAVATAAVADDTKLKVKVGDPFPNVPLKAAQIEKVKKDGKELSIADLKGKVVVVFFYPKASTKGCTVESCGFRDLATQFPADAVLIGASADDEAAQDKFIRENHLPMPLLCDTELKLIRELGVESPRGKVPQRITFVVGKDGTIAKIYEKVDVQKHPREVLETVKELSAK